MVNEAAGAVVTAFDLRFENYSWMAFLAEAGFDVFAMDLTGYGFSPRPMMDDACNTSFQDQDRYLIPNPLPERCVAPSYPYRLSNSQSDWDEIDTVVNYLRELRGVDKVSFVAWSRGGRRVGGYTARHAEKVERLFLIAPGVYNRFEPSDPPPVLPEPGVPMTVQRVDIFPGWDAQLSCEDQFTRAIRPVIASTILEFDPLGSAWGEVGVRRSPVQTLWGWNQVFALQVEAPTLVIVGDLDTTGGIRDLFEDLGAERKVFVHVACASHFLPWENQHMIMLRASEEWLRHGTFARHTNGSFFVDTEGQVHEE
jgi:pimeloyl-ACP methyl ester carboxylesterase